MITLSTLQLAVLLTMLVGSGTIGLISLSILRYVLKTLEENSRELWSSPRSSGTQLAPLQPKALNRILHPPKHT